MIKVAFFTIGNRVVGTGHIYRTIILSKALQKLGYQTMIYHLKEDELVEKISGKYGVNCMALDFHNIDNLKNNNYDVFVLDILDTNKEYVLQLKQLGKVVTFEDLGSGAEEANLVINALYPEKNIYPNHYYGHQFVEMRDEFLNVEYQVSTQVNNTMITFGGTDPCNFTLKTLCSIYGYCLSKNIDLKIITGLGYDKYETLKMFDKVTLHTQVNNMAEHMAEADIVFSSAGRTIYELACVGVPSIILCQNEREKSHFFASKQYGFQDMGIGEDISEKEILKAFSDLAENFETRNYMSKLMQSCDIKNGKNRVIKLITDLIDEENGNSKIIQ